MYAINVVMTTADVLVEGFCMTYGTHGSSKSSAPINGKHHKYAYIWVGNSETQCPGQCARLAVSPVNLWTTEPASGRAQPRRGYVWDGDQPG
ncbi:hypothetical protein RHGRI_004226 [Rhododendron griersonianum]|uniref:Uncharacterized protein n=1 Tax=Rhododendron griersonianum TaxID=479676 RepID=A0AAV6L928_9ERIC|nr:hypothetical protein RHGRI_004226 [Rhododendron griersonianum]